MRIGSLQNVNLQKWKPNDQRDLFVKSIPGYNMPLTFDLNSSMRTHVIDGILYDTSNANLAADMEYLEGLFRSGQLVWVDATDQYQALCAFGKIAKLQGPTMDASQGRYVAKFTMELWSLPPWGTMLFNPWRQTGLKMRDLDGVGAEYMLDPSQMHCDYTLNEIGQSAPYSFAWEFILDNQNPFTNVTSFQETACDSLGSGTASATNPIAVTNLDNLNAPFTSFSIDTSIYKEGTGSLKGTLTSPTASTNYSVGYDFGSSGLDISSYDRLRLWFRCDQAGQLAYVVLLSDTSGNWREYKFSLSAASTWMNLEFNLAAYSSQSTAAPSLSAVRWIGVMIETAATPPSSLNVWMDDLRVETGYINHCVSTNGFNMLNGSGMSLSIDTVIFKNSYYGIGGATLPSTASVETSTLGALKLNGTSSSNGTIGIGYPMPISNWSVSSYDFICLWVRSDFGGNTTGIIHVFLGDSGFTNVYTWTYSNLNSNQWYRLVVPLLVPTISTGSPSLSSVPQLSINSIGAASATTNIWLDEVAVDVGNWAYIEFMLPDNVDDNGGGYAGTSAIQTYTWNGSSYLNGDDWGEYGEENLSGHNWKTLDGSDMFNMYGQNNANYHDCYPEASIGVTVKSWLNSNSITYTSVYGCNNRAVLALKIPPATSDSLSGNLPSDDLSGMQAINKIRVKLVVSFTNDDTTYFGFNSL